MTIVDEPTRQRHLVARISELDPRIVLTRCGQPMAQTGRRHQPTFGHLTAFPACTCQTRVTRCEPCRG